MARFDKLPAGVRRRIHLRDQFRDVLIERLGLQRSTAVRVSMSLETELLEQVIFELDCDDFITESVNRELSESIENHG